MAQTITPTKTEPVFFSKVPNLRLVRDPGYTEVLSSGQPRTVTPGLRYEFQNGYLVCDDKLRERDEDYFKKYADVLGDKVDTRPVEEWLRGQDNMDNPAPDGYVEIAPMAPPLAPVLQEVTKLAIERDIEGLLNMFKAEEQGFDRVEVKEAIANAVDQLDPQPPAEDPEGA